MASVVRHGNSKAGVSFYGDYIMTPTCQPSDANMSTIRVHDWQTWQSFRSDRGAPPWIKVHRNLMTNAKWAALSDAEKGQLVSLWIAAADNEGVLPSDPRVLRKICQLDENPNLEKLSKLGLIEGYDANMTPSGSQVDANMTHQIREDKIRSDKSKHTCAKNPAPCSEFENFWKAYPVKKGKAHALKMWKRHNPPVDKCLNTIERMRKQDRDWLNGFIPHPGTWINEGRWNDEPDTRPRTIGRDAVAPSSNVPDESKQRRKEEMKAIEAKGYVFVGNGMWMDREGRTIKEGEII